MGSAKQINSERDRKTYRYISPVEVEALMRIYDVSEEEKADLLKKILLLQDEDNRMRPASPLKVKTKMIGRRR